MPTPAPVRHSASTRAIGAGALRRVWLWGPVAGYMAAIFFVSSLSDAPLPEGVSDTWGHTVAYMGLAILVVRAAAGGLPARVGPRVALVSLLVTIAYGASDELHQWFVPGRSADLRDVYADAVGAVLGVALCWMLGVVNSWRPRRSVR